MIIKKKYKPNFTIITTNKKAYYEYYIFEEIEAGLILLGWEVKAIRKGRVNITGSYILLKNNEAYLFGTIINPLNTTNCYAECDPTRTRKLLLNQHELYSLFGKTKQKGYTLIPLSFYWKEIWCKTKIGIAKGKKEYNKRSDIKEREWKLEKERIIKKINN